MPTRHEVPLHGTVRHLSPYVGFGFIETRDGREIYFHKNSVLNDGFDKLDIGAEVRFEMAEGFQAVRVESAAGFEAVRSEMAEGFRLQGKPNRNALA